ncbi:MAG: efflux RND transporter permease subunit, partial [Planctomycetota bacterium]
MILSDISVRRPVLATVISLVVVTLGIIGFSRLRIREYPDVDSPMVSIQTSYPGASANVVENRITQVIEDTVSGIAGIKNVSSTTEDGRSSINVEFVLDRDVDAAANDVRDRISRVMDRLPEEVDPPEISKANSMRDVSFWMNLSSPLRSVPELTDYAERYLVDRMSTVPGVARIMVGGGGRYAMRIWLDREAMAATGVTAGDVEQSLRRENVELPAGRVESTAREFTVRVRRVYNTAEDFGRMVISRGDQGHLVRLQDIARVEVGPSDTRTSFRGLREEMVGLGIIRQEKANSLEVIRNVKGQMASVNRSLPPDMTLHESYDTSVFIEASIAEVYKTLGITALVVIVILFLFLGTIRATIVPAITVPVSLIGTFFVLYILGFSINLLTLLALVLAIGLVVDDSIVVLENIERRVRKGEPALRAAFLGSRQVGFAVVATTIVLVAVFVPISLMQGNTGRLFSEFALAMAGAVVISTFVALTLSPALCARLLRKGAGGGWLTDHVNAGFTKLQNGYRALLGFLLDRPLVVLGTVVVLSSSIFSLFQTLPQEYAPTEDRGSFSVNASGPEGASSEHSLRLSRDIEDVLMELD